MNPTIYNANYLFDENLINFDKPVEIHVTRFLNNALPQFMLKDKLPVKNLKGIISDSGYKPIDNSYKIFIDSNEPKVCMTKETEEDIIESSYFYNLILTSNENVLKNVKHSKLFLYGTTWLNKKQDKNNKIYLGEVSSDFKGFDIVKQNNISFLKSNKPKILINLIDGYNIRERIWVLKNQINKQTKFYYSNVGFNNTFLENDGILPNDDKMNIFNSKFSIVIENSKEKNYFSEKLIDCLLTKTIPIYWGCPNIEEYFDISGFITFKNQNDFLEQINFLDLESFYKTKEPNIENNFNIAKKYGGNYSKRLEEEIKKYL